MDKTIQVRYREFVSDRSFEKTIEAFEATVGSVEKNELQDIVASVQSRQDFERQVASHEGESGFMRFLTIDHGTWTRKFEGIRQRGMLYTIGNPLLTRTMLKHDVAAGLNVPVRVYIYEGPDAKTRFGYHEPSSLMSAYESEELMKACEVLDTKLDKLAARVTGSATQSQQA